MLDLLPDAEEVRLLLGEDDDAFLVLEVLEVDLDLVTRVQRVRVLELVARNRALALEADVQDDGVVRHAQHLRADDLALLDVDQRLLVELEHRLVLFGRVLLLVEDLHARGLGRLAPGPVTALLGGGRATAAAAALVGYGRVRVAGVLVGHGP